jgi:hypothetical protein
MGIIDHVGLVAPTARLAEVTAFYAATLAPLGAEKIVDYGVAVGFGKKGTPDFWIGTQDPAPTEGIHLAFSAEGMS